MEVNLRPLEESDAYTSYIWRNDVDVWKYTGKKPNKTITLQDEINWIRNVLNNSHSKHFAIIANNEYVGNVQLTDLSSLDGTFHIFIGNKDYWSKGVAKKATTLILLFAFQNLNLKKVKLKVRIEHSVAVHLYNTIGFNEVERNNGFIFMEILRDRFIGLNNKL